jgi:hypothetical protein
VACDDASLLLRRAVLLVPRHFSNRSSFSLCQLRCILPCWCCDALLPPSLVWRPVACHTGTTPACTSSAHLTAPISNPLHPLTFYASAGAG